MTNPTSTPTEPDNPPFADPNWAAGECGCGMHKTGDISHSQMITELRTNSSNLRPLLHGLSEAQLTQPAPDGGWSIKQIVDHLAACTGSFYQRARAMATGQHPPLPPIDRGDERAANHRDLATMQQEYADNEARLVNLLLSLSDEQWRMGGYVSVPDGRRFDLTLDGTIVHLVDHDREHLSEMQQRREAMGMPLPTSGCICGLHHAGDISHDQIIAELRGHPDELAAMVQGLSEAQLTQPAPNEGWSIKQLIGHLRDAAAVYLERTAQMVYEDNPTMPRMNREDEANYNHNDLGAMLAALKQTDARYADLLAGLSAAQWQRTGVRKAVGGAVTIVVDDTAVHMVDHEREHLAEIRKLIG